MTSGGAAVLVCVGVLLVGGFLAAAFRGGLVARSTGLGVVRGLSLPVVEASRLLRQRRRTLPGADPLLWRAGGAGLVLASLLMLAVVPLGPAPVLDSAVGVVWFNAADVCVWAFVWLTGWGADALYGLVGGYRFLASALAYELPLMFALTTPAVAASSLRVSGVVAAQQPVPYVVWMPVAFLIVCLGVVGFSVWGPLAPAAGRDLAGGVLAELSGPDRLVVLAGRYLLLVAGAAFTAALFLGGGNGPVLPGWAWMLVKTGALTAVLVVVRGRVALLRPDRFLEVGWLILLPAALLQLLLVCVLIVAGVVS